MVSRTGVHALAALACLAEAGPGKLLGAAEIAGRINAPRNYLGKLLKLLADHGVLESQKGKGGGFRLARDPADITLAEVLEPIEHISRRTGCLLGQGVCSAETACAVHHRWAIVRDAYLKFLNETSVADLVANRPNGEPLPTASLTQPLDRTRSGD